MATAEEILREAEEALAEGKEQDSALTPAEQILAEAQEVAERERMALPPVVQEAGTVAEPLTEAAKGEKAPPLPPNPPPRSQETLAPPTTVATPAGPVTTAPPPKPVTVEEMTRGAEIKAMPKDWKAWMLPFTQEEPTKAPEIITQPKEEPPKQEISTKPLDIFLQLASNEHGAVQMDANMMEIRDSLTVPELAEVVKTRPDIPLNAKQEQEVYDYLRNTSPWRIPKDSQDWLNLGGAVGKFPIDMAVMFGETLVGVGKGAAKLTRDVALGEITGKDYNLAWQLHSQLPARARERVNERIGEYYPQAGYTGGGIEFTGKEYLDLVLQEYTPAQREEILKTQAEVIEKTKGAPMAFLAPAIDLPYQLAKLKTKVSETGVEGWDLLSEATGLSDYDSSFEKWRARKNFEGAMFDFETLNPTAYDRYLEIIAPTVNAVATSSIGSVEDYMREFGYTREQAVAVRQDDLDAMTVGGLEAIAEAKKLIPELDPDIMTAGEILVPEGFGLDVFGYGLNLLKLGQYATPKVATYLRFRGKTPDEINRIIAADAKKLKSKQDANYEKAQRVTRREKAAIAVDDTLKKAQEAIDRSEFFKRVRQVTPYVAGAGIGYTLEPESPLGVFAGLLGARMLKSTPEFIRNYYEARRLSAGGTVGTFEKMSQLRRDRQAAKGAPRAEGGMPIRATPIRGGLSDRLTAFGGKRLDSIIDNTREYIRAGIDPTIMGFAVGVVDSQDAEEMAAMMGQGLLWSSLGRGKVQFLNKVFGMDDPVYDARRRRKEDVDAWKTYQDLQPADRGNVDAMTDWQVALDSQQKQIDLAQQRYDAAVASNNAQAIQESANVLENNKKALERMKRANVQTRNEFGRLMLANLSGIHGLANGGFVAGQNNVGIRLLSTQQIKDHLRQKYPNLAEETLDAYASQDGFYDGVTQDTLVEGGIPQFGGQRIVMDDAKPTMVINTDAVISRIKSGQDPITALRHEAGHHLSKIPEYQELMAEPYRLLFKEEIRNANGEVIATVGEGLTEAELADLYVNVYAGTAVNPEFFLESVAQRDPVTGQIVRDPQTGQIVINQQQAAAKLREEITADLAADSMSRVFGKNPPPVLQVLFDRASVAFKRAKFESLAKKLSRMKQLLNIPDSQDVISDNSGARFTPEIQLLAREALEAMIDLQGQISPAVKGRQAPKITRSEIVRNKALLETYGTYSPLVVTEVQAQVIGPDGKAIGTPQVLTGQAVYEGSWDITDGGIEQRFGYGPLSPEINVQGLPAGSKIIVARQIAMQPDGVTPRFHQPKEAKKILKQRNKVIQEALDTPDYGAPNRFDPTKEGGETYRGTLSPLQVEALRALPESILPRQIKDAILTINDALVRGDGTRYLINYAAMMNERGQYEAFSPKYYDIVPIGLMMSKAGNFLATSISVGRMFDKLHAWGDRMPARLMPWRGSKEQFWNEFTNKYLNNWTKGFRGSGYNEAGAVESRTLPDGTVEYAQPLDADPQIAAMKRNVFNDFLNLYDNATEGLNPDRTKVPRRKGDPRNLNMDRTIMSVRLDHIAQIAPTQLPKMPVAYGLAKSNFMPRREGLPLTPEMLPEQGFRMTEEQRERLALLEAEEKAFGEQFREVYGDEYAAELESLRDLREAAAFMPMRPRRELTIDERVYPGFRTTSRLEEVVDQKIQGKSATPDQIRAIITNPQNGIKPAEVEWSGINEAIDTLGKGGQNINKADLMEYLRQNQMKFMLSVLGGQETGKRAMSWENISPAGKRMTAKLDELFTKYKALEQEARSRLPEVPEGLMVQQHKASGSWGIFNADGTLYTPPPNVARFPYYLSEDEAKSALTRIRIRQPNSVLKTEVLGELADAGWNLDRYGVLKALQAIDDFGVEEAERWSRLTAEAADETAHRLQDKRDRIADQDFKRINDEYMAEREAASRRLEEAKAKDPASEDIATVKAMRELDAAVRKRDNAMDQSEIKLLDLDYEIAEQEKTSGVYWRINNFVKDPTLRLNNIGDLGLRQYWPQGIGGFMDSPLVRHGEFGYRVPGDTNYREMILQVRPNLEVVKYVVRKLPKSGATAGKYEVVFEQGERIYPNLAEPRMVFDSRQEAERVARSRNKEQPLDFQLRNRGRAEGLEYRETHYDSYPYYIAHMRVGDRQFIDPTLRTIPQIESSLEPFATVGPRSGDPQINLDSLGAAVKNGAITAQEADFYAAYRQWNFANPQIPLQLYGGSGTSHLTSMSHIHEMQSDRNQAARQKDRLGNPIGYREYLQSYQVILNVDGGPDIALRRDFNRREDAEQYLDEYMEAYGSDPKLAASLAIQSSKQAGTKLQMKGGVLDTSGLPKPQIKLRVEAGEKVPKNAEAPPEAPFSQSREWGMALLKNAIVDAVKAGNKYVYWSGGDTQAKRWRDMAPLEKVKYRYIREGQELEVFIYTSSGIYLYMTADPKTREIIYDEPSPGMSRFDFKGKTLDRVIPKEMANKIFAEANEDTQQIVPKRGSVFFGGTKFKPYYNEIIVNEANKFLKKYGSKVYPFQIPKPQDMGTGEFVYVGMKDPKDPVDPTAPDRAAGEYKSLEKAVGEAQKQTEIDYLDADDGWIFPVTPALMDAVNTNSLPTFLPRRQIQQETSEKGFYSQLERALTNKIQGKFVTPEQAKAILGEYIVTETQTIDGKQKTTVVARVPADQKAVAEAAARSRASDDVVTRVAWNSANRVREDEVLFSDAINVINKLSAQSGGKISKDLLLEHMRASRPELLTVDGGDRYNVMSLTLAGGDGYYEMVFVSNPQFQEAGRPIKDFRSGHYKTIPGYLGHVRYKYRYDENGRLGIMIEEFQSDRAQKGRDYGWREEDPVKLMDTLNRWRLENLYVSLLAKQTEEAANKTIRRVQNEINAYPLMDNSAPYHDLRIQADSMEASALKNAIKEMLTDTTEVADSLATEGETITIGRLTERLINDEVTRQEAEDGDFAGIPDMPFKRDWGLQLFKRVLDKAVTADEAISRNEFDAAVERANRYKVAYGPDSPEALQAMQAIPAKPIAQNGVEWIGWTKGVTQVERYQDMMRQIIDGISYYQTGENKVDVFFYKGDPLYDPSTEAGEAAEVLQAPGLIGKAVVRKSDGVVLTGEGRINDIMREVEGEAATGTRPSEVKLSEIVGKKMASQIIDSATESEQSLLDADLTIGGEGMKGYYDVVQPSDIGKYMKSYGTKVDNTFLRIPEYGQQAAFLNLRTDGKTFWISMSDNMKPISPRFNTAAEAMDFQKQLIEGIVPVWKVELPPQTISLVEREGQPQFMPQRDPATFVRFDGELDKKQGNWTARIRVVPGPDGNGAFAPELYFEADTPADSKLLMPAPLKTFEQAQAELQRMFDENNLPMERFEELQAPIVSTDNTKYKPGAWENTLRINGFEDLIPSLEDQIETQQMREEATPAYFDRLPSSENIEPNPLMQEGETIKDALERIGFQYEGEAVRKNDAETRALENLVELNEGDTYRVAPQTYVPDVDGYKIAATKLDQDASGTLTGIAELVPKNIKLPENVSRIFYEVEFDTPLDVEGNNLEKGFINAAEITAFTQFLPQRLTERVEENYLRAAQNNETDKAQSFVWSQARRAGVSGQVLYPHYRLDVPEIGEVRVFRTDKDTEIFTEKQDKNWHDVYGLDEMFQEICPNCIARKPRQGMRYSAVPEGRNVALWKKPKVIFTDGYRLDPSDIAGEIPLALQEGYDALVVVENAKAVKGIDVMKSTGELFDKITDQKIIDVAQADPAAQEAFNQNVLTRIDWTKPGIEVHVYNDFYPDAILRQDDGEIVPLSERFKTEEGSQPLFLPKRKNPPVADFVVTTTGQVKLPKKMPQRGFYYVGLEDTDGNVILAKVDPTRVVNPVVKDLSDISGKRVGMVQADRHHTLGKDMGGPMHEFLKSNQETVIGPDGKKYKTVWGNLGLNQVNAVRNRMQDNVDDGYHLVQIMDEAAHKSNLSFGTDYIKEMDAFNKAGKLEPWVVDMAHVLLEIGKLKADKIKEAIKRGAANRKRRDKGLPPIPPPKNTPEENAIVKFNESLTPVKNWVARDTPEFQKKAKAAALKVYNANKNKAWFKRLLRLGANKNFTQEFMGYSFTERGAAMDRVSGFPTLPNVVKALQDSEDMINARTGQAVAVIQLSTNPDAFALYFGKDPKQEAAMSVSEKKMRDTLLKNPKFKVHPSYPWMMLGPANGNNFLIKTPVYLPSLFPNYANEHPTLSKNLAEGRPVADNDIIGSMLKTPTPELTIP